MSGDKHRRKQETVHFCANAAQPKCECATPNNYRKPCEAEAKKWGKNSNKYWQKHTKKDKKKRITKLTKKQRSHEAHHALPVSCVTNQVLKWDDKFEADVAKSTKWCINNKDNMIALPLWGHTIMHYCNNFDEMSQEVKDELKEKEDAAMGNKRLAGLSVEAKKSLAKLGTNKTEPGFKDLPQHNYGHSGKSPDTSYNKEITKLLRKAGLQIKDAAAEHKTAVLDSVAQFLKDESKNMVSELKNVRGKRSYGGTHKSWKKAMRKKEDWYESFGMAIEPKPMPFPLGPTSKGLADKISKMAQTMWMSE